MDKQPGGPISHDTGNEGLAPFAERGALGKYSVQMAGIILMNAKHCVASLRRRDSFQSVHTRT